MSEEGGVYARVGQPARSHRALECCAEVAILSSPSMADADLVVVDNSRKGSLSGASIGNKART